MPNGRCKLHGGLTPTGFASPHTKHGRYSKHMPTRMLAEYEARKNDPDMLAMASEIALLDARLSDVLSRVDSGESGHLWQQLKDTYRALQDANRRGDTGMVRELMVDLGSMITKGQLDYAAWNEIKQIIEARRKLVETERRRLTDMQQMMTAEQAMMLIAEVYEQVRLHVHDPSTLAAIGAGLAKISAGDTR